MLYPESHGANPRFPSAHDFAVVHKDANDGSGVVTFTSFEPGDLLAEFHGELLNHTTQHSLQIEPGLHIADLHFVGYLLHSCAPNVYLDMQARQVIALRPIRPNDFLTMDYAQTEDHLFRQFPCSCSAPQCRRWITGRLELPDQTDPRYHEAMQPRRAVV